MPVNVNLSSPEPDEPEPTPTDDRTGDAEVTAPEEPAKRKRRTKAEMLEDAVIPADGDAVKLKDVGTGVKIERPWVEAVALVDDGKAEWVDKDMKYARIKYAQKQTTPTSTFAQEAASAVSEPLTEQSLADAVKAMSPPKTDAFGRPSPEQLEAAQLPTDISGQMVAPEGAEVGDEVIVGADTYWVGHGHVLVDGYVVDDRGEFTTPKRRWQRVLGTGSNGPWESRVLAGYQEPIVSEDKPDAASTQNGSNHSASQNGDGDGVAVVWREFMPDTFERIGPGEWKVGSGLMDKIGLPDYSSLQVGPITASRTFSEDGEYTKVNVGGREEVVPVAGLRFMRMCRTLVELEGNYMRGELAAFLQTQGVTLAPLVQS